MSEYDETRTTLQARLRDQRDFRDSQPEGSSEWQYFQDQAQDTAQLLILLESNEAQLCALDNQVEQVRHATRRAQQQREQSVSPWRLATWSCGVAGVVSLAVGSVLSVWWVWLVAALLVGVSAWSGVRWMRTDQDARDATERMSVRLRETSRERDQFAKKVLPEK